MRERLGPANDHVAREVADVLDLDEGRCSRLWHDRALFHFLTEHDERDDYRASLARRLPPGGYLVVATFGPDGPQTCSGLPTVRYTHAAIAAEFPDYTVVQTSGEQHVTPWGGTQQFTAVLLQGPPPAGSAQVSAGAGALLWTTCHSRSATGTTRLPPTSPILQLRPVSRCCSTVATWPAVSSC